MRRLILPAVLVFSCSCCEPNPCTLCGEDGTVETQDSGATDGTNSSATDGADSETNDTGAETEYCKTLDENHDATSEKFADKFCCLCKDCYPTVTGRSGLYLDSNQLTCSMLELEMADPSNASPPGSATCHELQRTHRETCCNPDCAPRAVEQDWEPARPPYEQGNEPWCDLCHPYELPNGQFPLKPYTITAVLGIPGNPTCEDLYWMGRTGNIEGKLCYPMQDYMEQPCGCAPPGPPDHTHGNEPWCDICPNGQYPLRPTSTSIDLDIPRNPSCKDLYWMGRTGNIAVPLCQKLQQEMQEPCGCLPAQ